MRGLLRERAAFETVSNAALPPLAAPGVYLPCDFWSARRSLFRIASIDWSSAARSP